VVHQLRVQLRELPGRVPMPAHRRVLHAPLPQLLHFRYRVQLRKPARLPPPQRHLLGAHLARQQRRVRRGLEPARHERGAAGRLAVRRLRLGRRLQVRHLRRRLGHVAPRERLPVRAPAAVAGQRRALEAGARVEPLRKVGHPVVVALGLGAAGPQPPPRHVGQRLSVGAASRRVHVAVPEPRQVHALHAAPVDDMPRKLVAAGVEPAARRELQPARRPRLRAVDVELPLGVDPGAPQHHAVHLDVRRDVRVGLPGGAQADAGAAVGEDLQRVAQEARAGGGHDVVLPARRLSVRDADRGGGGDLGAGWGGVRVGRLRVGWAGGKRRPP